MVAKLNHIGVCHTILSGSLCQTTSPNVLGDSFPIQSLHHVLEYTVALASIVYCVVEIAATS